ncbi:MAG: hypothetical protein ACLPJH_16960 [Myxococcaceae bacterium]
MSEALSVDDLAVAKQMDVDPEAILTARHNRLLLRSGSPYSLKPIPQTKRAVPTPATLSADDLAVAAQMGLSPEAVAAVVGGHVTVASPTTETMALSVQTSSAAVELSVEERRARYLAHKAERLAAARAKGTFVTGAISIDTWQHVEQS